MREQHRVGEHGHKIAPVVVKLIVETGDQHRADPAQQRLADLVEEWSVVEPVVNHGHPVEACQMQQVGREIADRDRLDRRELPGGEEPEEWAPLNSDVFGKRRRLRSEQQVRQGRRSITALVRSI